MKPTDTLFSLIKSLSKSEKRYFNLFASRHVIGEGNTYLKLFEVVGKQKQYNESHIKEIFKKDRMGKNLAAEKNRLYNLVLKSLSDFHSKISIESKLREYIHQVEVLYEKGLYGQMIQIIQKAKKIAAKNFKQLYFLELQRWEKRLISINQSDADVQSQINKIYKDDFQWTNQYKKFLEIQQVYHKVLGFQQIHGDRRRKDEFRKLKKTVDVIRSKTKESDLDRIQKIYYFIMLSVYYRLSGDTKRSYQYLYDQQALYDNDPSDNTDLYNYVSYLNNLSIAQMELCKYDEVLENVHKIRRACSLPPAKKSSRIQTLAFLSHIHELDIYSYTGNFNKGTGIIKSIQKELEKRSLVFGTLHMFSFWIKFAVMFFGTGEYKKSLLWTNKIINHPEQNIRLNIHCLAKILALIIHYELHNEAQLPYYIRSVYRYLLKKQRLFKFETLMIEFIRKKISKINSTKDLKTAFIELNGKLLLLKKDHYEKQAFNYFDFISWLESKIEKRPFAEIVKEKAKSPVN
jgi:hypothetical protein